MKRAFFLSLAVPLAFACGSSEPSNPKADESDIIGGARANGRALDAVGSLAEPASPSWMDPPADAGAEESPKYRTFCTATLVASRLVLTAKHCVQHANLDKTTFNIGPDGTRPKQAVKVKSVRLAGFDDGGFVKLGADVAILELATPIVDVKPLKVLGEPLAERAVGSRLSAVGFGIRDRARTLGQRLAGTLTLQATEGAFAQKRFASLEELVTFAKTESPEGFGWGDDSRLDRDFWQLNLLPEYEAFLGLGEGDSQPCSGDSGGPLVARMGNDLVVTAVVSGSFKLSNSYANPCSVLGEVYATFGPVVQTMFDEAELVAEQTMTRVPLGDIDRGSVAALPPVVDAGSSPAAPNDSDDAGSGDDAGAAPPVDRCRGLSTQGTCDSDAVLRCIAESEGPPRASRVDCSLLLSKCEVGQDGVATCADL